MDNQLEQQPVEDQPAQPQDQFTPFEDDAVPSDSYNTASDLQQS